MSGKEKFKVEATRLGFFNFEKKHEGAIFFVNEDEFSEKWMKKIGKKKEESKPKAKAKGKGPSKDDEVI